MRISVYVKKALRLDRLTFDQRQMFKLGNVALASRKYEISQSKNAQGGTAKPLMKRYAIKKTIRGKGNRRNLYLTGAMLREWQVRQVSNNSAVAAFTTRLGRLKAMANSRIEPFISFSPQNTRDTIRAGQQIVVDEKIPRMVIQKGLNGQ